MRKSFTKSLPFTISGLVLVALVTAGLNNRPASAATNRFVSPSGNDNGGANTCTDPDSPCQTIQNAVNQSAPGDTIDLAAGTYTENVVIGAGVGALTIQGDAAGGSIVDGNNVRRVFLVGDVNVTFSMLTITNGNAINGAGIGMSASTAEVTVNRCTISGNTAHIEGGAVFNQGTLTVINSTIENNFGGNGGGIANGDGISNPGTATIVNSTISGNSAQDGGGIDNFRGGALELINSTIANNSASDLAGGIFNNGGIATIVNSTISGNSASLEDGAGILVGSTVNLTNTIVAGNTPTDLARMGGNIVATNDHNLVADGSLPGALTGNPMLGPLQNNGGPTATMALLPGSPAIGGGDNSVVSSPLNLTTDQRGPGFPREIGARVDIGAYEFGAGCPAVALNPVSQAITGGPVTFTAGASGDPTPTVQWQVSTNGGVTFTNIPGATGTTLTLTPTLAQSGDEYRAVFTNECGSATTTAATLTVLNVCLKDNTSENLLQWNSVTGQYVFTRCSDGFTLTGTGTVGLVDGAQTLMVSKSMLRLSAGFATGQLTGTATIYVEVSTGVWETISINDTNPHATCSCLGYSAKI